MADNATGAEGDIIIKEHGKTIMAIEITERQLDHRRIISTFNTKIISSNLCEYLFLFTNTEPDDSAHKATRSLFSQGYEIKFANVIELIINNFSTITANVRCIFANKMLELLSSRDIPATIKLKWNDSVKNALQISI